MVLKPCFGYVTRVVLVRARLLFLSRRFSAALPVGSCAGETDSVLAVPERCSGLVETDTVLTLSERVCGLVETDAVRVLSEHFTGLAAKDAVPALAGIGARFRGVAHAAAATAGDNEGAIALMDISEPANATGSGSCECDFWCDLRDCR